MEKKENMEEKTETKIEKEHIVLSKKKILITGAAGFIGANLAKRILTEIKNMQVIGIDNMNSYYDVSLKESRLKELEQFANFTFQRGDIADQKTVDAIFERACACQCVASRLRV